MSWNCNAQKKPHQRKRKLITFSVKASKWCLFNGGLFCCIKLRIKYRKFWHYEFFCPLRISQKFQFFSPTFQLKLMQPTDQLEDSDTPQILAIQDVPYEDQGWLVLDVTKAVKSWQYDYKTNQGLVLNVVDANGNPVLPKDAGLNTTRYIIQSIIWQKFVCIEKNSYFQTYWIR